MVFLSHLLPSVYVCLCVCCVGWWYFEPNCNDETAANGIPHLPLGWNPTLGRAQVELFTHSISHRLIWSHQVLFDWYGTVTVLRSIHGLIMFLTLVLDWKHYYSPTGQESQAPGRGSERNIKHQRIWQRVLDICDSSYRYSCMINSLMAFVSIAEIWHHSNWIEIKRIIASVHCWKTIRASRLQCPSRPNPEQQEQEIRHRLDAPLSDKERPVSHAWIEFLNLSMVPVAQYSNLQSQHLTHQFIT